LPGIVEFQLPLAKNIDKKKKKIDQKSSIEVCECGENNDLYD
jgi:hypothetical protein